MASLAFGMSVRLTSGMPTVSRQNSIERSRSVTLMQYCPRIATITTTCGLGKAAVDLERRR